MILHYDTGHLPGCSTTKLPDGFCSVPVFCSPAWHCESFFFLQLKTSECPLTVTLWKQVLMKEQLDMSVNNSHRATARLSAQDRNDGIKHRNCAADKCPAVNGSVWGGRRSGEVSRVDVRQRVLGLIMYTGQLQWSVTLRTDIWSGRTEDGWG